MSETIAAVANNRNWRDIAKKAANTYMNFSFGCGQDAEFAKAFIKEKKTAKIAWTESKLGESWWSSFKKAFSMPEMKGEWNLYKKGTKDIKPAGNFKSGAKFFMKRMPFIGNAIYLATETPNLIRSFTDTEHGGGAGSGIKETVKVGIKAVAFAAGTALGGLLSGGLLGVAGGLAGGFIGGWIADKLLGKSFTDEKEENEAKKAQQLQQQQQANSGQQQLAQNGQVMPFQGNQTQGLSALNRNNKMGSGNSVFQMDWKDKDLGAMSLGYA